MNSWRTFSWGLTSISVLPYLLLPPIAFAQIVPDGTVNTRVTPQGNTFQIEGGTTRGNNLFHSFEMFSLSGGTAYFNNASSIENIFSRVTGSSPSLIDGWLKANGRANLFFLNPNGIVFGANARLDIGGSFLATTADRIDFADGTGFRAVDPSDRPLLTVEVPVGLQLGNNPGEIRVRGTGQSPIINNSPFRKVDGLTGLQVRPGKTLALIGGDIALENAGTLTAPSGKIELGSIGSGAVSFSANNNGWNFNYEGASSFRNIRLAQQSLVDASGQPGGSIALQGRNIFLLDGSFVVIQNQGERPSGTLNVKASDLLQLSGNSPDGRIPSSLRTEAIGMGDGSNIAISTRRLINQGGAGIDTITYGDGDGGNIGVNASESIQLIGFSFLRPSFNSNIQAFTFSSGKAGNITVSTGDLTAIDGGIVASATLGTGEGGDVLVDASRSIELTGVNEIRLAPSGIGATAFDSGNAGDLTVNTSRLRILQGATVNTSAVASGSAGNVTINASDAVEVSGRIPNSLTFSTVSSSAPLVDPLVQQIFNLPPVPSGTSGNVTINTRRLTVTNGGQVSVRNDGTGNAGTLFVNAPQIFLNSGGSITAATAAGNGGEIAIDSSDLRLADGASIAATAGSNGNQCLPQRTLSILGFHSRHRW